MSTHSNTQIEQIKRLDSVSAAPVARLKLVYMESYAHKKSKVP